MVIRGKIKSQSIQKREAIEMIYSSHIPPCFDPNIFLKLVYTNEHNIEERKENSGSSQAKGETIKLNEKQVKKFPGFTDSSGLLLYILNDKQVSDLTGT